MRTGAVIGAIALLGATFGAGAANAGGLPSHPSSADATSAAGADERPPSLAGTDDAAGAAPAATDATALDARLIARADAAVGTVTVEVVAAEGTLADAVAAAGGTLLREFAGRALVTVPAAGLRSLARQAGVQAVRSPVADRQPDTVRVPRTELGPVNSLPGWGQTVGRVGAGERIGVIGLFDAAVLDTQAATGEIRPIPAAQRFCIWNGTPCSFGTPNADFGNAVTEVISEIAEGSTIYLAELNGGLDYVAAIDWFAANGVDKVLHYWDAPLDGRGDGTGFSADVIDYAVRKGILWVNSAGTLGMDYQYAKYAGPNWAGIWKDSDNDRYMEWKGTDESMSAYCGALTGVRWSDWGASRTDYDLYISDYRAGAGSNGPKVLASAYNQATGGATPIEGADFRSLCNQDPARGPVYDTNKDGFVSLWLYRSTRSTQSPTGDVVQVVLSGGWLEHANNDLTMAMPFVDSKNPAALIVTGSENGAWPAWYMSRGFTTDGRIAIDMTDTTCLPTSLTPTYYCQPESLAGGAPAAAGVIAKAAVVDETLRTAKPAELARFVLVGTRRANGAPQSDVLGWGRVSAWDASAGLNPLEGGSRANAPNELRLLPAPVRVLETRASAQGGLKGTTKPGPIAPDSFIDLDVTAASGLAIPLNAVVLLNVTSVSSTNAGWVQVMGTSASYFGAYSSLNIPVAGRNVPNIVTVSLTYGSATLYTFGGGHLLADLIGWFEPLGISNDDRGRYEPLDAYRVLDTATCLGVEASCTNQPVAAQSFTDVQITGTSNPDAPESTVPTTDVYAAVVSLTAVDPVGKGFLSVLPAGAVAAPTSTLNTDSGRTVSGMAIVPISAAQGSIRVFSSIASHLRVDVLGYFRIDDGPSDPFGTFMAGAPTRVLDTRTGGAPRVPAGTDTTLALGATLPVTAGAAWLNIVGVQPTSTGELQLSDAGVPAGHHTSLAMGQAGVNIATASIAPLTDRTTVLSTTATTHEVVDLAGWFFLEARQATPGQVVPITLPNGDIPDASLQLLGISGDADRMLLRATVNSVPGLSPGLQIVVYDLSDQTFTRVDLGPNGVVPPSDGASAIMSSNGRFVLLTTVSKLIAADTDNMADVYLRDTIAGTTELVGVGNEEQNPTTAGVAGTAVSDDGNVIVLQAASGPGFPGDSSSYQFIRRRNLGTTVAAVSNPDWVADLTADGTKYVTINSLPTTFYNDEWTSIDLRAVSDGHLIDRYFVRCETPMFSLNVQISDDGSTIAYGGRNASIIHTATGVVDRSPVGALHFTSVSNGPDPVYGVLFETTPEPNPISVWQQSSGFTNVNITADGSPANGSAPPNSYNVSFPSHDGRYIVFTSVATNLVPGLPDNANSRVYVFDRQA